jgi:hypothetical protein
VEAVEKAQVLLAFAEWQATYSEPAFDLSAKAAAVMSALFQAFRPWNVALANMSGRQNPANAADVGILVNLLNDHATFSVGIAAATLVVKNPRWSEAEALGQIGTIGFEAVEASVGSAIRELSMSLSIHLKPSVRTIYEISKGFLNLPVQPLDGRVRCYGFSVYGEEFSWIVDSSALYDDTLFFKITRRLGSNGSFAELVRRLRSDQLELLGMLNLEVD